MKGIIAIFAAATFAAALSGCSHSAPTVAWYEHHAAALKMELSKCNNDPGELQNRATCVNAEMAQSDMAAKHAMSGIPDGSTPPAPFNPSAPNPCPHRSC